MKTSQSATDGRKKYPFTEGKNVVKASTDAVRKNAEQRHPTERWIIAKDILTFAKARNMILTKELYAAKGWYSIAEVEEAFGSFEMACRELKIVNPDDIDNYPAIIADIHRVATENKGMVTPDLYRENGIFSYDAVNRRYGFSRILVTEGLSSQNMICSFYPVRTPACHIELRWNRTYQKRFYQV